MSDGEISYARAADGVHIAYRTQGQGPLDILEIGGFGALFPLDAAEDQPRWRRFEERIHQFARLTKFDLRSIGYSDQCTRPPTVDDFVGDALAVLDAAGIDRAVLLATSYGAFAAIELAARHPERVSKLVLVNAGARLARDVAEKLIPPEIFDWDEVEQRRAATNPSAGGEADDSDIDVMAPSIATDPEVRRWWTRTARRGASPAAAAALWDLALEADVRTALLRITCPTLVIATSENRFVNPQFGVALAAGIAGAELSIIPAPDHLIWAVPDDRAANEIERYVTGSMTAGSHARTMVAILFTDIVDSTAHNTTRGDRAWLELLARHDQLAERDVTLRGGRVVKRMGDGLLAVFPLVSDALATAAAIAAASPDLGLAVRAGVHAAEVEQVGDDVLGLGVTIAARVLGQARGGEVVTTRAVVDLIAGSGHVFESRGRFPLKGVAGEWELLSLSS